MKEHLSIPAEFNSISDETRKNIEEAFDSFEELIVDEQPFFFPGYTTHGRQHLNGVLKIAAWLLTEESRKLFGEKDIEWLCYATLLHDSAMHMRDSHFHLLKEGKLFPGKSHLAQSWPNLWQEFEQEAKHWTTTQRINVFGEDQEIPKVPDAGEEWEEEARLYVGEFLRRHHHSLAYCIAINGLPKPSEMSKRGDKALLSILGSEDWESEARALLGLIAKSHGDPLRVTFDILYEDNRHDEWRGPVHPTLLMALLRLADYFQFEGRADKRIQPQHIQSPFSKLEWKINRAVYHIRQDSKDKLALYIDLKPKTLEEYLRLDSLLRSMQNELDATWTVLGECYSAHDDLRSLAVNGIWVRRIRSTIDSPQKLQKLQDEFEYVPARIELKVSNSVLPLLAGPIYGEDQRFAVREILANAQDAVYYKNSWIAEGKQLIGEHYEQNSDIRFDIVADANNTQILTCTDQGIGMMLDTIQDFFLTAGHSFRNSRNWKNLADKAGHSIVGRFGIGILSYFLLGDTIEISTRHVSSVIGYKFTVNIDKALISITPVSSKYMPSGTKVSIKLSKKISNATEAYCVFSNISWQCNNKIGVEYYFEGKEVSGIDFSHMRLLDTVSNESPESVLVLREYIGVPKISFTKGPSILAVNGIAINRIKNIFSEVKAIQAWPNILVEVDDPNALFPLTLDRSKLLSYFDTIYFGDYILNVLGNWLVEKWKNAYSINDFEQVFSRMEISPKIFSLFMQDDNSVFLPPFKGSEGNLLCLRAVKPSRELMYKNSKGWSSYVTNPPNILGINYKDIELSCLNLWKYFPSETSVHPHEILIAREGSSIFSSDKFWVPFGKNSLYIFRSQIWAEDNVANAFEVISSEALKLMDKHHCNLVVATPLDKSISDAYFYLERSYAANNCQPLRVDSLQV